MPLLYQLSWSACILSKKCIENVSYMIGAHPYWYESSSQVVDIDTEEDWEIASIMYARQHERRNFSEKLN